MPIPEWLKAIAVEVGQKGLWVCKCGRNVVTCPDCRVKAATAYQDAKDTGALETDPDHINKYRRLVKTSNGEMIPEGEPYLALRGQDQLAPVALRAYLTAMTQSGFEGEAIDHMQEHILEFMAWPIKKLPD